MRKLHYGGMEMTFSAVTHKINSEYLLCILI